MQYTCSYLFMSHVHGFMAYIWYITFAYNVSSIKIRVHVNTHGYIYVMWQNKSEHRMDMHDLEHIFFILIATETWGSFTSYMGVQYGPHIVQHACICHEIWKTLLTHLNCQIVLLRRQHMARSVELCAALSQRRVELFESIVNVKLTDTFHSIRCGFIGVVNKLIINYMCGFFNLISYLVIIVLFYGSQLRHLTKSGSKSCYVQWNKAVSRLPILPYRTYRTCWPYSA